MKKILFLLSLACVLYSSCQKENEVNNNQKVSIKAIVEPAQTKADINSSYQTIWRENDEISVYLSTWTNNKYQPFILDEGKDTKEATFTWNGDPTWTWKWTDAKYAFYPKASASNQYINQDNGTFHYNLPTSYDYTSEQSVLPLAAYLGNVDNPTIEFKYLCGAVKISLKDVPAKANSIELSLGNNVLTGWHYVPAAGIGGDNPVGLIKYDDNTSTTPVKFNFAQASDKRDMVFLFPVPPTSTAAKVKIDLYHDTAKIWSVESNKAQSAIARKDVLAMPQLTVAPYTKTITVGIISYLTDPSDGKLNAANFKIHYWGGYDGTVDKSLTSLGTQESKQVGYWDGNPSHTFNLYSVEVPSDITGFKIWYDVPDSSSDYWFGSDGSSSHSKVYVFDYGEGDDRHRAQYE